MSDFKKYNAIVNETSAEIFQGTDFYFYPVTPQDYADFYKTYKRSDYPVMAFIYLTNQCADNCVGCFARAIEDGQAYLELDVIRRTLKDLAEHGTKAIKLAGREPTCSPYLSECLDYSRELGLKSLVISSGALIHRHKEALANSVTHLRLSLNTINEELHNAIHRPTDEALRFNERIQCAREIIARRRANGLVTGATYLVRRPDDENGVAYAQMCRDMGFDYVRYTVLDSAKGEWSDQWRKMHTRLLATETPEFKVCIHNPLPEFEFMPKNPELVDPAIISRVVIHANGKVNCCQEGWRGKWVIENMATYGNVNEQSFHGIWTGEKRNAFMDYIIRSHSEGYQKNGSCVSGCSVCKNNCKYKSFNAIEKWIISEMEQNPDSVFTPIALY